MFSFSRLKRFTPDALVILALLLLPLFFFFPQTLGGQTLIPADILFQYDPYATYSEVAKAPAIPDNHLVADLILQNYQWKSFIREQLAIGEVPLWNPHQFSGIPFLAAGQHSAFYPLSAIYYVLPLWLAYGWFTVINLWLAGVFMYAFGRGLGLSRPASMLAGVIYQFGGFVIASVVFQMMIGGLPWLPLMLLMTEFVLRERSFFGRSTVIPWVVIGAGALGMNILAGHVEITIYTLLITGYYAAIRLFVQAWQLGFKTRYRTFHTWHDVFRRGGWLLAMVALGFGLSAVQFLPLLEFVQVNWRADRASYDTVVGYAHPIRDVLQFALPNFYGNPAHQQVFDVFSREMIQAPWDTIAGGSTNHTEWGIKNYVEAALYVGILPLLLAVYGLIERVVLWRGGVALSQEPPYRRIFASLGVLSLTFMFGLPTYRLIYVLPGINQLNSPFRWVFALTVCVAILAAFGLDGLLRRASEKDTPFTTRFGQFITVCGVLVLSGLAASYAFFPRIEPFLEQVVRGMVKADTAFADARMFYSYQFQNVLVFGVMLLLSGALFWWAGKMRAYRGVGMLSASAVLIVVADLMIASWGFNPAADPALLNFKPPVIEWLQAQQDESDEPIRYITLQDPNQRTILPANMTMRYGLYDVRGYDSIIPRHYVDYMQGLAPQVQLDFNRIAPLFTEYGNQPADITTLVEHPQLDALNVRYIITHKTQTLDDALLTGSARFPARLNLVYEDEAVRVFERPGAVFASLYEPADTYLDEFRSSNPQSVQLLRDTGRERLYAVDLHGAGTQWLGIHETHMPGWRAFITPEGNGSAEERPLPVERVLDIFKGVRLYPPELETLWEVNTLSEAEQQAITEGRYQVRVIYSPASVQVGLFGSVISVALLTLMIGMWLWRVLVGVNTDDSSQAARVARNSVAPIILNLFNRGIDFAFLLVMLRVLPPEQVGIYYYLVILFEWFDIMTNFGLDLFLTREVARDKSKAALYFINGTLLRLVLAVVGIGLVLGVIFVRQATVDPALDSSALLALALLYVGLFPASLSKGMTSVFYAFEQAEKPAAIATITSINKAIFGVMALLLGYGIVGLAGVSIINNLITFAVLLYTGRHLLKEIIDVRPQWSLLKEMIREGFPLMLNHFLATIFFKIDVVLLEALRGAGVVARYSIAYKWILAINIIPSFFTQALLPVMSRQAQEDRSALRRNYQFGIKLLVALALPLAVIFTAVATPLTFFTGGAPYLPDGAIAIQLMIWSIPIGWMNSLTQYVLVAMDLQRQITRAFVLAVGFNLITNALLIPQYGYQAAALTTIASELVLFIPFAILTQRGFGERIEWVSLLWRPALATLAMIAVTIAGAQVHLLVAVFAGSVVYAAVFLALKPLTQRELTRLQSLLPERAQRIPFLKPSEQAVAGD